MQILRPLRARAAALVLAAALPLVAACQGITGPDAGDRHDLNAARQRWQASNITTYSYTVHPVCFCGGPRAIIVRVRSGAVAERTDSATGQPVPAGQFSQLGTVNDLFAVVQDALDRDARSIRATYHATTGAPLEVYIDYSANVADEEFGFTTSPIFTALQ